jgi:two-component system sensor histidine kinase/response regulator
MQLAGNVVGIAIKFTEQGEVVLRVEVLTRAGDDVHLRFTITDTGIGIPPEKHARIFEAFSQADGSSTRLYGGTGLGLTICTQLVELMGGVITVESEVGRGSVFRFDAHFRLVEAPAPSGPPRSLEGMRVLVVDDNDTNRRILEGALQNWAMRPTAVGNGAEALAAIGAVPGEPFQLVLLDASMPGMDGFMFAERLRSMTESPLPIIMMLSSASQRGDAARCRALGIQANLMKPVRRSELLQAIVTLSAPPPERPRECLGPRVTIQSGGAGLRILLAEDNVINQRLAARLL